MKIFFRVDASVSLGTGYVNRSLALAEAIGASGEWQDDIRFIMRDYPGALRDRVEERGFSVFTLPDDSAHAFDPVEDAVATRAILQKRNGVDWLVADRIGTNSTWDSMTRKLSDRLMVIDDMARQERKCDVLLNQNYLPGVEERYRYFHKGPLLLGPAYLLLRSPFRKMRNHVTFREKVQKIVVAFGGGDTQLSTELTLQALQQVEGDFVIDLVLESASVPALSLENIIAADPRVRLHHSVSAMAQLTLTADLAIGAYGVSLWERMSLGVPNIVMTIAEDQVEPAKALAREGYLISSGDFAKADGERLVAAITATVRDVALRRRVAEKGRELVDGRGAERVAAVIENGFFR